MSDPQQDPVARLEQVQDDIDTLLDGGTAREIGGKTVGQLEDIEAVYFGLYGRNTADVRLTQVRTDRQPASVFAMLGELLDGLSQATGLPRMQVAAIADQVMVDSQRSGRYEQLGSVYREDEE